MLTRAGDLGVKFFMVTLSNPKDGWITLNIKTNSGNLEIEFSDVGPNSIKELSDSINNLKINIDSTVEFFLEPCCQTLNLKPCQNIVEINSKIYESSAAYTSNKVIKEKSYQCDLNQFISSLQKELERIIPLCKDYNWSNN